jgi:hypothetical protein
MLICDFEEILNLKSLIIIRYLIEGFYSGGAGLKWTWDLWGKMGPWFRGAAGRRGRRFDSTLARLARLARH